MEYDIFTLAIFSIIFGSLLGLWVLITDLHKEVERLSNIINEPYDIVPVTCLSVSTTSCTKKY